MMIFKLTSESVIEYAQAKSWLDLFKSYNEECGLDELTDVVEVSEKEAKNINLRNSEYDEDNPENEPEYFTLFDAVVGDDFVIVGSTEWI